MAVSGVYISPGNSKREQNDVIIVIMAAALTLTIDRWRLTCLVVSFVFCMHLVKSTMSLDITTRHGLGMRQLRNRRQDNCSERFKVFEAQYDRNAVQEMGQPVGNAAMLCMRHTQCTGYVEKDGRAFFSISTNQSFINDTLAITYTVSLRCPKRFRCTDSPCKNEGTCVPPPASGHDSLRCRCHHQWTGWYCERLKSCADEPCELGETCCNSTTAGFICTSNDTSTTKTVTSTNTIVASTISPNKTMDGSVLSRDAKVVIGAAAVGGVVIAGVAAAAVFKATGSGAATTAAGAAGAAGGQ